MSVQSKIQRPDKRTRFSSESARQPDDGSLSGFLAGVRFAGAAGAVRLVPARSPASEV